MPCVALILLLIYRKNNLLYFHHFITSLHFHSFMFLLFAIAKSVYFFNEEISISNIVTITLLIYLFFMLKNIYIESLTKVIIKFALLICIYVALSFSIILIIGTYIKST